MFASSIDEVGMSQMICCVRDAANTCAPTEVANSDYATTDSMSDRATIVSCLDLLCCRAYHMVCDSSRHTKTPY